jgi:hypothetical protein
MACCGPAVAIAVPSASPPLPHRASPAPAPATAPAPPRAAARSGHTSPPELPNVIGGSEYPLMLAVTPPPRPPPRDKPVRRCVALPL